MYVCRNKLGHTYFSILVWIRSAKQTSQMSALTMLWLQLVRQAWTSQNAFFDFK